MPSVFAHTSRMRTATYKISYALKWLVTLSAFGGVILSLFTAQKDGYSHWSARLLYFTAQSNIWLGFTFLMLALFPLFRHKNDEWKRPLYLLKYVFTVCILVTALVFCALLAPFSDESYRAWTVCNLFTHVVTPALALMDYFIDPYRPALTTKNAFLCALPALSYLFCTVFLVALHVDFGRGVEYPYFFINYRSPVGFFGFSSSPPFVMGVFYWLILFAFLVVLLAFLLKLPVQKKRALKKRKKRTRRFI